MVPEAHTAVDQSQPLFESAALLHESQVMHDLQVSSDVDMLANCSGGLVWTCRERKIG